MPNVQRNVVLDNANKLPKYGTQSVLDAAVDKDKSIARLFNALAALAEWGLDAAKTYAKKGTLS